MASFVIRLEQKDRCNMSTEQATKLTPQEEKLIRLIRTIEYGEVHIFIKENKPIRVEEIRKSIRLD